MSDYNAQAIWTEVVERVKDRTINPGFWEALEKARGVTIDDQFLVVGFGPVDFPLRGHLTTSEYANTITVCIKEVTGKPLRLRVIEGLSLADYENAKAREAAFLAAREAAEKRRKIESAAAKTWEATMEQVSRGYAKKPMRQLPQTRARYLREAIDLVVDAMRDLYPSQGQADELTERAFSRVIEKLAAVVEMPSTDIAERVLRRHEEVNGAE